jgi:hypothetical protein
VLEVCRSSDRNQKTARICYAVTGVDFTRLLLIRLQSNETPRRRPSGRPPRRQLSQGPPAYGSPVPVGTEPFRQGREHGHGRFWPLLQYGVQLSSPQNQPADAPGTGSDIGGARLAA